MSILVEIITFLLNNNSNRVRTFAVIFIRFWLSKMTEIQVICAGLSMTTEKLSGLLGKLNYKIYDHVQEKDIDKWLKIHKDGASDKEIKQTMKGLMKGFTAVVGHPSNGFAVELLELYPNAKVILTVDENSGIVDLVFSFHWISVNQNQP